MQKFACSMSISVLILAGCSFQVPEGLAPTPEGNGPEIVFDLDARPFPDIPFPNDLATRPDPSSPTGRRVNASQIGTSAHESRFREYIDQLSGFSTFAAMSVSFDQPLNLADIQSRHGDDLDWGNDAVYVVNLSNGQPVPLDLGGGAYTYILEKTSRYYPNDPRAGESNLVFETVNEDINGNGLLDPGEDSDWDDVLDVSNTFTANGDPVDDLVTFFERETNTLIIRPLIPLEQETRYAVILTNRLVGLEDQPVRSPFDFINHTQQTDELSALAEILPGISNSLSLESVAFCWCFTTQSITRDLEHLRMGLYGQGPFAYLAQDYPPDAELENAYDDPSSALINPFTVPANDILDALEPIAGAMLGDPDVVDALFDSYKYVDYMVLGRAKTPLLLHGLEGIWSLDENSGEMDVSDTDLPWLLVVPKQRPEQGITAPFPVAIYLHGTGGDRMQVLGFAGQLAKFGIASVGVDLVMHGMVLPEDWNELFTIALGAKGFGKVAEAFLNNRTVDINNDGVNDPAGNFWTYDAFRSRDAIRQSALDIIRLIQVFRGFDGTRTWELDATGDGSPDLTGLAGDFNQDGTVDLVGPDGPYFIFGISLGGITSSVAAAMEPAITAAVPISSGGGLVDVSIRSLQTGVPEMVMLPFMGPLVLGLQDPETAEPVLALYVPDSRFETIVPVHSLDGLKPGDKVRLVNERNGEEEWSRVGNDLTFRMGVPCDKGDPFRLEILDGNGQVRWQIDSLDREVIWQGESYAAGSQWVSLSNGFGIRRQSPEVRRFIQIAQMATDAGDPVNYSPLYWQRPSYPSYPEVGKTTNVVLLLTNGDMNVPVATGIAQARAAGMIPYTADQIDSRYGRTPHQVLVDNYVIEGIDRLKRFKTAPWLDSRDILMDVDYLSEGLDLNDAPILSEPLRLSNAIPGGGQGGVRFFYVNQRGAHGIGPADPGRNYDIFMHGINAIGHYFRSGGTEWVDDTCLADDSCAFIPTIE
ncbi:MAG: hypothetical protein JRJ87_16130 [Deltaproteobacteria bacterium]|nr:hypothetical protein [Deltaproteobacteria bacterium]